LGELFGTDGIRGIADTYPMTADMAVRIGKGAALFFKQKFGTAKIIVGKDTRISGNMLESAVGSGICAAGMDACLVGILPTPGVAYLTAHTDAVAGIVISASHNPYHDNGIKLFAAAGFKLSDADEMEIERLILDDHVRDAVPNPGRVYRFDGAEKEYADFLKARSPGRGLFQGLKIVLDCSNGATYRIAPKIFDDLGADIVALAVMPDGKNINQNCGSEHLTDLQAAVIENKADIGLAFDGDGDRLLAVDDAGHAVRGDQILVVCAKHMKQKNRLKNNTLVTTVMSNIGLGIALKELDITHVKASVGDRYVLESMVSTGAVLGGEDSGHIIFRDHHTTGDGILAGIRLIEAMVEESKPLSELAKTMKVYPQVLINVTVADKPDIHTIPEIQKAIKLVEDTLGEQGRVLVRYSGTQPLCRIMVEGPTMEETTRLCQHLTDIIKDIIGQSD
jgi:phosphoglucosamine mutase